MAYRKKGQKPSKKRGSYYPYGLKHSGYNDAVSGNVNHTADKFNYLGQEEQVELGLNWMNLNARNYDASLGRFMNIDPLSELTEDQSTYHYGYNNPVFYLDPTGLTGESFSGGNYLETQYIDERGNEIVNTDDGSDDIVTVSDEELEDFTELVNLTHENLLNSQGWNDHFKSEFLGVTIEELGLLDSFTTQWSRQNAINYWQNPTAANVMAMSFSEALSQWTDVQNLLAAASIMTVRPRANVRRVGTTKKTISEININEINPLHEVPRPGVPPNHIQNIARDIGANGYNINQAIPVLRLPNGKLVSAGGHHRVASMQLLGEETIPGRVVNWNSLSKGAQQRHLNAHYGQTLKNYLNE